MPQAERIQLTVRIGEPLRRAVGRFRLNLNLPAPATPADLIAHLGATYPDFAAAYAGQGLGHDHPYRLFVNNKQAPDSVMSTLQLDDGDLIHIVVPVVGG